MNSAVKLVLAVLLIGAVAFGISQFLGGGEIEPPPVTTNGPADDPQDDPELETVDPKPEVADPETPIVGDRTEVDDGARDTSNLPQGVRGRCVTSAGAPIAGVDVALRKAVPGGFFGMVMQKQQGMGSQTLAAGVTDENGEFRLGVRSGTTDKLELFATSAVTIDKRIDVAGVKPKEWHDFGNVELAPGAVVYGMVTDKRTNKPIEGARVAAKNPMTGGISPAPGREEGTIVTTDASGRYRIENLAAGTLLINVSAEGYAQVTNHEQRAVLDQHTEFNVQLPAGLAIAGRVIDENGQPVAGAVMSVVCLSQKTPLRLDIRSNRDGSFRAEGLVDAPFQINVQAPGFRRATAQPVNAGTEDQEIVLERQGGIRVQVRGSGGRVLKGFAYQVMRWFPQSGGKGQFGAAYDVPGRAVTARDLDEDSAFRITGMNPGQYAVLINAKGYAKTKSDTFTVDATSSDEIVTITMQNGGRIEGVVNGPDGGPMRGVRVTTLPSGYVRVPIFKELQDMMPTEITKTSAITGADGTYRLDKLAPGEYQLQFTHPDVFEKNMRQIVVADGQTTSVEMMALERGTRVSGVITVDGKPGAGVKVSIGTAPTSPALEQAKVDPVAAFAARYNEETLTNERGEYVFPSRVPPGEYTLRAGRTAGNPLMIMLDFTKTERTVTLQSQDDYDYSVNILTEGQ